MQRKKAVLENYLNDVEILWFMKISELQPKQGNVDLDAEVVEVGEPRTFNKFGKEGKVANAKIKDDSGKTITLTLWNDDVDKVKPGSRVSIKNGYVSEWQGEMQLGAGKFGEVKVVSGPKQAPGDSEKKESGGGVTEESING